VHWFEIYARFEEARAAAKCPPAQTEPSSAVVEGQTLSVMVETIRGKLGLANSLTVAQVIAQANHQLAKPAEGTLATQAKSLLGEII